MENFNFILNWLICFLNFDKFLRISSFLMGLPNGFFVAHVFLYFPNYYKNYYNNTHKLFSLNIRLFVAAVMYKCFLYTEYVYLMLNHVVFCLNLFFLLLFGSKTKKLFSHFFPFVRRGLSNIIIKYQNSNNNLKGNFDLIKNIF